MPIVKYKNQSGVTYAYEQTSVYDSEKKQSRPVRKYLGRVDPDTGEIISTKGKRGRPPKQSVEAGAKRKEQDYKALYKDKCAELENIKKDLTGMAGENERLMRRVEELTQALVSIRAQVLSVKGF